VGPCAEVAGDPSAELLVAGRSSSASLTWLERRTAARVRALIEERGLRASALAARPPRRPAASACIRAGAPARAGRTGGVGIVGGRLADGALVDSRVLLAHRLGADERRWPAAEDRYASDLLLHERVADPWLRRAHPVRARGAGTDRPRRPHAGRAGIRLALR
jgi:hypothetical protein